MTKKKGLIKIILFVLVAVLCWSTFAGLFHTKPQQGSNNTNTQQTSDVPDNPPPEEPELIIDPVLENNSWETIKAAFRAGVASDYWQVGDTKTIDVADGYTYTVRISDMAEGRYAYSDGSGYSNNVFEFVECMATTRPMNSTATNVGGFAECELRTELNTTILGLLPADLQVVIAAVSVDSTIGGGSDEVSFSDNKLFLASEEEIFGTTTYSKSVPIQFGYWVLHDSNAEHIKIPINGTSNCGWHLRSPHLASSKEFCVVSRYGGIGYNNADSLYNICPFFCL